MQRVELSLPETGIVFWGLANFGFAVTRIADAGVAAALEPQFYVAVGVGAGLVGNVLRWRRPELFDALAVWHVLSLVSYWVAFVPGWTDALTWRSALASEGAVVVVSLLVAGVSLALLTFTFGDDLEPLSTVDDADALDGSGEAVDVEILDPDPMRADDAGRAGTEDGGR